MQEREPTVELRIPPGPELVLTDFTARVADVAHAVVVSADGVPLALSEYIPHQFAEQLAAITSGLTSLMVGRRGSSRRASRPRPWWKWNAG